MQPPENVMSAGVLCYSYADTTQDIYFLLGREEPANGGRWSDFGGKRKDGETEIECASREFVEESMGIIGNRGDIQQELEKKKYTFRIALDISTDRPIAPTCTETSKNLRICYLKQIPWLPDLPERFEHLRQQFLQFQQKTDIESKIIYFLSLPIEVQQHCAFTVSRASDGQIVNIELNADCLEKRQIGWWSLYRLRSILRNGGSFKNKYCFRIGFLSTLAVIVEHFGVIELFCQHLLQTKRDYVVDVRPPLRVDSESDNEVLQFPLDTLVDCEDEEEKVKK